MDEYLITYNLDSFGGPAEPHEYNPQMDEYMSSFEAAAEESALQAVFYDYSDGDEESGPCAPEYTGYWIANTEELQDFVNSHPDLNPVIYEMPRKEVIDAIRATDSFASSALWDELVEVDLEDTLPYLA